MWPWRLMVAAILVGAPVANRSASTQLLQSPEPSSEAIAPDCESLAKMLDSLDAAIRNLRGMHLSPTTFGGDSILKTITEQLDYRGSGRDNWRLKDSAFFERRKAYNSRINANLAYFMDQHPDCPAPYLRLGDQYADVRWAWGARLDSARHYYELGLSRLPDDPRLIARVAWLEEMAGNLAAATALYKRLGWVDEYRLDGVLEAQRIERRHELREYFFNSYRDSYIEVELIPFSYRVDSAGFPDIAPYEYAKYRSDGWADLALVNYELLEKHYAYRKYDTALVSRFVSLLEHADFMLLRNQLSYDSNHVYHHFTMHSMLTRVKVHTPHLAHEVFVSSLDITDWAPSGSGGLTSRLDSLAVLVAEALSTDWITDTLNVRYGSVRPFVGDDGVVRYKPENATITRVRPKRLAIEWQTVVDATFPDTSCNSVCDTARTYPSNRYVFDLGDRVLGLCTIDGCLLYEVSLPVTEWPFLEKDSWYLVFGRVEDGIAALEYYDYRSGAKVLRCEVGADSSYYEQLYRSRDENDLSLNVRSLKRGALKLLGEFKSNRPARDEHPVW